MKNNLIENAEGIQRVHLLNLPLGDFNEYSEAPMTQAKKDLIELSQEVQEKTNEK